MRITNISLILTKAQIMRLALIFGTVLLLSCNKNKYTCKCNVNASSESYVTEEKYTSEQEAISACNEKQEKIEKRHENDTYKTISCQTSKD